MINVLILSVGTRNKVVQYFKRELEGVGNVIATDNSELAPALYEADKHYIVPRIDDPGYLDTIIDICKKNKVRGVLSLIDPELTILATNKEKFIEHGILPIVSDSKVVELSFDKYKMYEHLKNNGINTVRSYIDKEEFYRDVEEGIIDYPVFIKPVKGSASINISKVNTQQEVEVLFTEHSNLMIQEYMDGKEFGADAYIDFESGMLVSLFIKEKLKMRAGETDKSVSYVNCRLVGQLEDFIEKMNYRGVIDIDIFQVDGEFYISEVNPRFGGGYPHGYECGVNIPKNIINNLMNIQNKKNLNNYDEGIYMMKYNEVLVGKL